MSTTQLKKIIDISFCLYLNPCMFFSLFAEFYLNQSSIGVVVWCWSSLYMWCVVWHLLFLWCWWPCQFMMVYLGSGEAVVQIIESYISFPWCIHTIQFVILTVSCLGLKTAQCHLLPCFQKRMSKSYTAPGTSSNLRVFLLMRYFNSEVISLFPGTSRCWVVSPRRG